MNFDELFNVNHNKLRARPAKYKPCKYVWDVYGLFASDEPLQVRYVGKTSMTVKQRLEQHLKEARRSNEELTSLKVNFKKVLWIREVLERGAVIEVRSFGKYLENIDKIEHRWIHFWQAYCDLLNIVGNR